MLTEPLKSLQAWVIYFGQADLPVLRRTATGLAKLKQNEDNITARDIANLIRHDPMMTLRLLRYLQSHRRGDQQAEITTIEHAIMMLGTSPFFRSFSTLPVIEDVLVEHPQAVDGLMRVMSRAYHAALYARDWSGLRNDIESDEVLVAALLHDLAEMLLWCFAPELAMRILRMMQRDQKLRSVIAQKAILGFELRELQMALASEWRLPTLLQSLMDDRHAEVPRVRTVHLGVELARHSANGWFGAALPDDYAGVQKLLNLSPQEVQNHIHRITLAAAAEWEWYGVAPPARWLPLLPEDAARPA